MKRLLLGLGVPALAVVLAACGSGGPAGEPAGTTSSDPGMQVLDDGITLTSSSPERLTGVFADKAGDTIRFDLAKVNDDLYFDLTGNVGRPIIHIETVGDNYEFSYMGGALKMHTTKAFVAQARAQAEAQRRRRVDRRLRLRAATRTRSTPCCSCPRSRSCPTLSRALGVRGITGSQFPASLALHKAARQSADALGINVEKLDTAQSLNGYCQAYPNQGDSLLRHVRPGLQLLELGVRRLLLSLTAARSTTAGAATASGGTATTSRRSSRSSVASRAANGDGGRARGGRHRPPARRRCRRSSAQAITNGADDAADPGVVALLQGYDAHLHRDADRAAPPAHRRALSARRLDARRPTSAARPATAGRASPSWRCGAHPAFDAATLPNDVAMALLADAAPAGATPWPTAGDAARRRARRTSLRSSASGAPARATRRRRKSASARRRWRR